LIADTDIQFSESFEVDGGEMFKHACKTGLEGVVSKVRDSKYASGRINDWVKKDLRSTRDTDDCRVRDERKPVRWSLCR
jgi:ATP-dependent DNA ligase